jgi:sulfopropanediol 3-dehydrogenase
MPVTYLKKAVKTAAGDAGDVRATVQAILDDIEAGGDVAARKYAEKFDKYAGNLVLTRAEIDAAAAKVSPQIKDDIRYAYDNVRRFAEAQKSTITDVQVEVRPGLVAGQKAIPCEAAGCYAPGGRYSHVA